MITLFKPPAHKTFLRDLDHQEFADDIKAMIKPLTGIQPYYYVRHDRPMQHFISCAVINVRDYLGRDNPCGMIKSKLAIELGLQINESLRNAVIDAEAWEIKFSHRTCFLNCTSTIWYEVAMPTPKTIEAEPEIDKAIFENAVIASAYIAENAILSAKIDLDDMSHEEFMAHLRAWPRGPKPKPDKPEKKLIRRLRLE